MPRPACKDRGVNLTLAGLCGIITVASGASWILPEPLVGYHRRRQGSQPRAYISRETFPYDPGSDKVHKGSAALRYNSYKREQVTQR